jgi:putative endopeptidase
MKLNQSLGILAVLLFGLTLIASGSYAEDKPEPAQEKEASPEDKPADAGEKPSQSEDESAPAKENTMYGEWGVETGNISKTVSPGDDFYVYVNEGWLNSTEVPEGFPRKDSFVVVHLRTEKQINTIINDLLAGKTKGMTGGEQVKALYDSYMDEARVEELGLKPIQAEIDAIMKAETHEDITRLMVRPNYMPVVGMGVDLDAKNPKSYAFGVIQAGTGLPESTYYTSDEPPFPQVRSEYTDYIEGVFTRAGIDKPRERAEAVVALETELAKVHWSPQQMRDPVKTYHPMTGEELKTYAPGIDWDVYMEEFGVADQERVILYSDTAIKDSAAIFAKTPVDVLRSYTVFHFINNQAFFLPKAYADAHFDFFSGRLQGVKQQRARSLRAIELINKDLGEVMGRMYVERYFPPESKAAMEKYIPYIKEAFRERVKQSEWMDEATKKEANAKLDGFVANIGYPDQWRDFSVIEIKSDDLIGNHRRIAEWEHSDSVSKLKKGDRREWEWGYNPQQVNAYYSPTRNQIVFLAAILQPPFFDPNADPAANFGAIGAVIGHEMGHGFDDKGSQNDADGVLRDWWTPESRKEFEKRAAVLVEQYNQYEPIKGTKINGRLTLGENIGDLTGITVAYTAYRKFVEDEYGGEAPVIDGLTGDQRFFLAWAQLWRQIQLEDSLRRNLLTDGHSPGKYRANGTVRNLAPWYEAFDVTEESDLYIEPEKRVEIW